MGMAEAFWVFLFCFVFKYTVEKMGGYLNVVSSNLNEHLM